MIKEKVDDKILFRDEVDIEIVPRKNMRRDNSANVCPACGSVDRTMTLHHNGTTSYGCKNIECGLVETLSEGGTA